MSNTYHKVIALKCKELLEVSKKETNRQYLL